jgi:putative pre-16S rRNA nuclease
MRALGVDFGQRRIGLALSDASLTLARPWKTIAAARDPQASAAQLTDIVQSINGNELDEPIHVIVVGLPRRLGGEDNAQTPAARAFVEALRKAIAVEVVLQDERLTSREAEARLAVQERDWRRRKEKLDAVAAAIILQDYLDTSRAQSEKLIG